MDALSLFLSYNSEDRPSVVAVQKLLEARGITTFLDRDRLVPGLPWPVALEDGLRSVCGAAVFLGRDLGGWQKREMWFALDRQVREEKEGRRFPVIPVLLAGADLTPSFLFLNTWIDLRAGVQGAAAFESLAPFEHALRATPSVFSTERVSAVCPYRGLEAFREEDAAFFVGRTAFAKQLFDFTLEKDLIAVVGPSGSGKSSIVQAGLVPLLRRELPPSTIWDVISFTPGNAPFHRLALALVPLLEPNLSETDRLKEAQKLGDGLAAGEIRLETAIVRVIEKSNGTGRLLVVADQFEEVFTLTPEPDRRPFALALLNALGKARFGLLLTLRADFYSQIITLDRDLSDRLAPAQVNIGSLTPEELRESITAPAKLVGLEFEPGLVDRILRDVGSEPGNLPLLEFTLSSLWSRREGHTLTNKAYNHIGGVTGALTQRAEAEFATFTLEEQSAVRSLFSRLVRVAAPEEGSEDTRIRIELRTTESLTEKVARAMARPEVRLLVMSGETEFQTIEVAHEALIRSWERLRVWLNEDREFLLWRQRTQIQVPQWQQHGHDAGDLLRGASLAEAERWLTTRPQDIPYNLHVYIGESVAFRQRELEADKERREAELQNVQRLKEAAEARANAEQQRGAEQTRYANRLRRFSVLLAALLLLALGATGFALWEATTSRTRELVAQSASAEAKDPELAVFIAAEAVSTAWPLRNPALPESEQRLREALLASHVRLTLILPPQSFDQAWNIGSLAWSPDGKRLVTGSSDGKVRVWDPATGTQVLILSGHDAYVVSVAWSPDGKRLATGSKDNKAKIWDAATGKELLTIAGHTQTVNSVAWSPDSKRLSTGSDDNTAKIWDAATGKELLTLGRHDGSVYSVAWSPDGKRLAIGCEDNTAKIWDAVTGKELLILSGHNNSVASVAWSPDGKRLATGSSDGTAKIWDAAIGSELLTLSGHIDSVASVVWSPDGKRLATGSGDIDKVGPGWDDTAKVWDTSTGKELLTLRGHKGPVFVVAWSPDGTRLATGSGDCTVKLWDVELPIGHKDAVFSVAWSPDGKRLATSSQDRTAKVWDASTGKEMLTLSGHSDDVRSVAWSPDGTRLATGSGDHTARIWDADTGRELLTLSGRFGEVYSVAWSPDCKRLATASLGDIVKVWDPRTGNQLLSISGAATSSNVAWSPDGKRLATSGESYEDAATEWDAGTGKEMLTLSGHNGSLTGVSWSPDGNRFATGSGRNAVIWDANTGAELLTLSGHRDFVVSVAWSPDGKKLATSSRDHTAIVWDVDMGNKLLTLSIHGDVLQSIAWSPDGKKLAATSNDHDAKVWDATSGKNVLTLGSDEAIRDSNMDISDLMALARERSSVPAENCQENKCTSFPKLSWW